MASLARSRSLNARLAAALSIACLCAVMVISGRTPAGASDTFGVKFFPTSVDGGGFVGTVQARSAEGYGFVQLAPKGNDLYFVAGSRVTISMELDVPRPGAAWPITLRGNQPKGRYDVAYTEISDTRLRIDLSFVGQTAHDGSTWQFMESSSNSSVTLSPAVTTHVLTKPAVGPIPPVTAQVGETVTFSPVVEAKVATYQWYRLDGASSRPLVADSARYPVGVTGQRLQIRTRDGDDGSSYRLIVTNAAGEATATGRLSLVPPAAAGASAPPAPSSGIAFAAAALSYVPGTPIDVVGTVASGTRTSAARYTMRDSRSVAVTPQSLGNGEYRFALVDDPGIPASLSVTTVGVNTRTTVVAFVVGAAAGWSVQPRPVVSFRDVPSAKFEARLAPKSPATRKIGFEVRAPGKTAWTRLDASLIRPEAATAEGGVGAYITRSLSAATSGTQVRAYYFDAGSNPQPQAPSATPAVTMERVDRPESLHDVSPSVTLLSANVPSARGDVRAVLDLFEVGPYVFFPTVITSTGTAASEKVVTRTGIEFDGTSVISHYAISIDEATAVAVKRAQVGRAYYQVQWNACLRLDFWANADGTSPVCQGGALDTFRGTNWQSAEWVQPLRFGVDLPPSMHVARDSAGVMAPASYDVAVDESQADVTYAWYQSRTLPKMPDDVAGWGKPVLTDVHSRTTPGGDLPVGSHRPLGATADGSYIRVRATDNWGQTTWSSISRFSVQSWDFYRARTGFSPVKILNALDPTSEASGLRFAARTPDEDQLPDGASYIPSGTYARFGWHWLNPALDQWVWYEAPVAPAYRQANTAANQRHWWIAVHVTAWNVQCAVVDALGIRVPAANAPYTCLAPSLDASNSPTIWRGGLDQGNWLEVRARGNAMVTVTDPALATRLVSQVCGLTGTEWVGHASCTGQFANSTDIRLPTGYHFFAQNCSSSGSALRSAVVSYTYTSGAFWYENDTANIGVGVNVSGQTVTARLGVEQREGGSNTNATTQTSQLTTVLAPRQKAFVSFTIPATLITGRMTVVLGSTTYMLPDASYVVVAPNAQADDVQSVGLDVHQTGLPDTDRPELASSVYTRPMTDAETKKC